MVPRIEHIKEDGVEKKRCCNCQNYRNLDNYNSCKKSWDNLRPECKICLSEKRKENKEKMTEYNKKYWENTKEDQKIKNKKWRENNKEYVKEKMKEWTEKNHDYKKQKDNEYRKANWGRIKEYNRDWNRKNYNDLKTNPNRKEEYNNSRIKKNVGRRIREMLKQNKSKRTMNYVGCSLEDLKKHLEANFEEGMTWENYGVYKAGEEKSGWHIDHIIPCDAFNFENDIEKNACFFYLNLQPLWGNENITKSNTYDVGLKEEYIKSYKSIHEIE
jgi:hypothetical protein